MGLFLVNPHHYNILYEFVDQYIVSHLSFSFFGGTFSFLLETVRGIKVSNKTLPKYTRLEYPTA